MSLSCLGVCGAPACTCASCHILAIVELVQLVSAITALFTVKTTEFHCEPLHLLIFISNDRHCHLFLHHTFGLASLSFTSIHFTHSDWIPLLILHLPCSSLIFLSSLFSYFAVK